MTLRCIVIFFLISSGLRAQSVDTLYYNNIWKLSSPENAMFIRVAEVDSGRLKFVGPVQDFYPGGKVFMTGNYSGEGKKDGDFTWFYPSGAQFMKGEFSQDSIKGIWTMYFPNGNIRQKIGFEKNDFTIWELAGDDGTAIIREGSGMLQDIEIGVNPTIYIKRGEQVAGKKIGKWVFVYYTSNGYREFQEEYKGGFFYVGFERNTSEKEKYFYSMLSSQLYYPPNLRIMEGFEIDRSYIENYNYLQSRRNDTIRVNGEIFTIVEQEPEYPGGLGAFYQSIARNLRYPSEARRMGVEGKVFVQFVIDPDGTISEVTVIKGIGADCDEEAARVIKLSEKWLPGLQRGSPVKVRMILPITFKLG